jgi:hypothetical protein
MQLALLQQVVPSQAPDRQPSAVVQAPPALARGRQLLALQ